jgi:hypothetical protein
MTNELMWRSEFGVKNRKDVEESVCVYKVLLLCLWLRDGERLGIYIYRERERVLGSGRFGCFDWALNECDSLIRKINYKIIINKCLGKVKHLVSPSLPSFGLNSTNVYVRLSMASNFSRAGQN